MKIAISSTGKNITDNIDPAFARCPYFIIAEIEDQKIKETQSLENKNKDQLSGVGVLTAQLIAENKVQAVITKNLGPRAADTLKQLDIKAYKGDGIIEDVLQNFAEGKLKEVL